MKYPKTSKHCVIIVLLAGAVALFSSLDSGFAADKNERAFFWVPLGEVIEAAEQGNADAQYSLGRMYAHGKGVTQNYVVAHMWFDLCAACSKGDLQKTVAVARNQVAAKMSAQQIAEAQRMAREWKPRAAR